VVIDDRIRIAVKALVAAALAEGALRAWAKEARGEVSDEEWWALIEGASDGEITARGLREVAESDLLALLSEIGR
jgi:hypothetical protein